jgi:hypothetical protein
MKYPILNLGRIALAACSSWVLALSANAGTLTIVGNGAGGGPIFVTSNAGNIDIGTRVRIGTFLDLSALSSAITSYRSGASNYASTLLALNNNFADVGTGVTNYGSSSQVANGGASFVPSTSQFGFNNLTTLSVNGVSGSYTTFNGTITSLNYSLSIGSSKNLYIWTSFNNEIAIVRNANGTGTANWTTPTSDGSNVTLNLSGLQATAGGVLDSTEILLGSFTEYGTGSDLIRLEAVPEPSTGALMMVGAVGLVALRRLRKV